MWRRLLLLKRMCPDYYELIRIQPKSLIRATLQLQVRHLRWNRGWKFIQVSSTWAEWRHSVETSSTKHAENFLISLAGAKTAELKHLDRKLASSSSILASNSGSSSKLFGLKKYRNCMQTEPDRYRAKLELKPHYIDRKKRIRPLFNQSKIIKRFF